MESNNKSWDFSDGITTAILNRNSKQLLEIGFVPELLGLHKPYMEKVTNTLQALNLNHKFDSENVDPKALNELFKLECKDLKDLKEEKARLCALLKFYKTITATLFDYTSFNCLVGRDQVKVIDFCSKKHLNPKTFFEKTQDVNQVYEEVFNLGS